MSSSDPNQCSGHGSCIDYDVCQCEDDWVGNDCQNERFTWTMIETPSVKPQDRTFHSLVEYKGSFFVFGGNLLESDANHLFQFDSNVNDWFEIVMNLRPTSRWGHSAVVYDDGMWIFGGRSEDYFFNDLWVYNFTVLSWNQVFPTESPSIRSGHSAVLSPYGDQMWIFGGNSGPEHFNELWKFSFSEYSWTEFQVLSEKPNERFHHAAVVYHDAMWIYGGHLNLHDMWNLTSKNDWQLVTYSSPPLEYPPNRIFPVVYNEAIWSFGGVTENTYSNDLWKFDFHQFHWEIINTPNTGPTQRAGHRAVVYQDAMWIFGGNGGDALYNDLWKLIL